jgi:integrase
MASIQERKDKNGKTSYRVQVRIKGYAPQRATFERRTDAKLWAQQTEAAIREGRHFKTTEAKKHTLGQLIDRYMRDILPLKKKAEQRQGAQLLWWKQQLGQYLLADVTPSLLGEQRDKLARQMTKRKELRSPSTVVRYLAALSHAFTIAVNEWGWLEDSPMRKVTKPREPRGRVRFLSEEERTVLLKACKESSCPHLYPVVVLALSTGMRQSEIMNLKWRDIDLQKGRITLHETKNGERRVVHVAGHALKLLHDLDKIRRIDTQLLFPSKENPLKPIDLRFPWETALKASKIEDFRFHDLRHSAASELAMNGASLAEIAEVLGHRTIQMTKRYSHLSESHTAGVVASMNEKIFG